MNGSIDDVQIYNTALSAKDAVDLAAVGYWTFDEGTGTSAADATGNASTATLQSSAGWGTGRFGTSALSLNGTNTSFADIPHTVINTAQSFTVTAWVNLNALGGNQTAVSLDGSQVSAFYLQLRSDGKFAFTRLASDSGTGATAAASTSAPTAGTWYHLAGVYDATAQTISLYVNGALQQTTSYTTAWQGTGHTGIGRGEYYGGPVDFFNGLIDDVHIYDFVLAIDAINSLAATVNAGLGGYWKFDEGTGTTTADASGNGHVATLQSSATWTTGKIGSHALSLNGTPTSFADVASSVVNTAQSFSVAAWVNLNSLSGFQTIVSLDGSSVSAFFLQLKGDTGTFAFTRLANDSTSSATTFASATIAPTIGTWYHLVGVYDASAKTLSLYVNGSLQQTISYTSGWQGFGDTIIGRGKYGGNPVDFVNGSIDEVHIYNTALSAKDAVDLAAVGYWTFDEGTGTSAADATGNASTATLQSSAGWGTGRFGDSALSLNGTSTSFADIPHTVINTAQSFTVTAWVNLNALGNNQTAVSLDGSQVSAFYLQLRSDGKFAFTRLASDSGSGATAAASTSAPTAGTWYHLAGVYDATAQTISLYVNGALQQTTSYTTVWQGTGHTGIGRGLYNGGPVDFFNGLIDDVHIYDFVLDYAGINTLAAAGPSMLINADQTSVAINPLLYGLMFEDISHSGDGGIYAELIRNRSFQDNSSSPDYWSLVNSGGGSTGTIALDTTNPVNTVALTTSLKLQITTVGKNQRVGIANAGFWGIPVRPHTTYTASFYARTDGSFHGELTVDIESTSGKIVASETISKISTSWKKYTVKLTTGNVTASTTNQFVISAHKTGTIWFSLVSLFPPTWHNRANGLRPDLMQLLKNLNATFLRFPGGNYLEGQTLADYFPWKKTLGDLSLRPGHNDPWGYRSSDGLGLLEYLTWCEDLNLSPLLAVYAGFALDGTHVPVGTAQFNQIIQDALDEIEYATGSTSTTWGARRAADGHPHPFTIEYVEIGNEDFFDCSDSYDVRFTAIFDAIRAAYPNIKLIATTNVTSRTPDLYDQHFYPSPANMESMSAQYDRYSRSAPKIFVGEYASQEGQPTPDLNAALGDAAFVTGLERNSDVVSISCYAPLLSNVNAINWSPNLIAYDALNSYGSPSYYMLSTFAKYLGTQIAPSKSAGTNGIYFACSTNAKKTSLYIKLVNTNSTATKLTVNVNTTKKVSATGKAVVISSTNPSDTNTLTNPTKIVPVTSSLSGLSNTFNYTFAAYSVTVLVLTLAYRHAPSSETMMVIGEKYGSALSPNNHSQMLKHDNKKEGDQHT